MRVLCAALLWLCTAAAALAENIVVGLSESSVSISTDFSGSEIIVYGAVRREAPAPDGPPLEVIVTVQGPSLPQTIRRKDRVAGLWINAASVVIDSAPSFYAVATTRPLAGILSETEDQRHRISIPRAIRAVGLSNEADNASDFVDAFLRVRADRGDYRVQERSVFLAEDTLFRTDVDLPANLTEGNYRVRIFLTRGGAVVDSIERSIGVRKVGLERMLFRLSREEPLAYGILAILLAAVAGWGASAIFQRLRL